ncbi:MAG: hypothetical protein HC921_21845 [Synechococcaceae cyanobacterium SM2_3_1]|nr:hypothetical protein [Synechococcaceae cyanobacterium SM2_3_1]
MFANLAISVHHWIGNTPFVLLSLILAILLCWKAIPYFTDRMVNAAAGLAGRYLGKDQRVLVINASTNNPELASMLVALSLGRLGGIANPLGSNFANVYLMFLIAPVFVLLRWIFQRRYQRVSQFLKLLLQERILLFWHLLVSLVLFCFAWLAYYCLTGIRQFTPGMVPRLNFGVESGSSHVHCYACWVF